jgi:hypothetical protein
VKSIRAAHGLWPYGYGTEKFLYRIVSFSTFNPIEFVFSYKFEFSSKFGTPNSKSERKRFKHFSDRFLLFIQNILNSKFGLNQFWPTRSQTFEKLYFFHMISNEDDFYKKIVVLDEIYNCLVFSFFI